MRKGSHMTADDDRKPGTDRERPTVMFLCVHNAGRSQMAAGLLSTFGGDRINVVSAGSEPADQLNPQAVAAMAEIGIDISGNQPQVWTRDHLDEADVVVTMGCGDACPVLPGKRYVDWPLDDPAGQPLDEVRRIREEIAGRVLSLMDELGVAQGERDASAR